MVMACVDCRGWRWRARGWRWRVRAHGDGADEDGADEGGAHGDGAVGDGVKRLGGMRALGRDRGNKCKAVRRLTLGGCTPCGEASPRTVNGSPLCEDAGSSELDESSPWCNQGCTVSTAEEDPAADKETTADPKLGCR